MAFTEQLAELRQQINAASPGSGLAAKAALSSQLKESDWTFNGWHANKDNCVGTDSPWGSTR